MDFAKVLEYYVSQYVPTCEASVKRNGHMNHYDGEFFDTSAVEMWLTAFVQAFAVNTDGDVMRSMGKYASTFYRNGLPYRPTTTGAIIVDFINYVAQQRCGMDLAMYTMDLD